MLVFPAFPWRKEACQGVEFTGVKYRVLVLKGSPVSHFSCPASDSAPATVKHQTFHMPSLALQLLTFSLQCVWSEILCTVRLYT